jgi:hypothetical protein
MELAVLDTLPLEDGKQQRCSVISEDLLEFSENLIECESADDSDDDTEGPEDPSPPRKLVPENSEPAAAAAA